MKKIFASVAIIATMIISASCGNRSAKVVEEEVDTVEVVDTTDVAVTDSTFVALEAVAE